MKNKKVLITGGAGSIGSGLVKEIAKFQPKEILALDQDESGLFNLAQEYVITPILANIREKDRIEEIFQKHKPEIVFHAAAYKHVGLMEKFPREALKTNILGTRNLIDISLKHKVEKFVFISSDKAVNPISVMGQTKKEGERMCQSAGYIAVRFGNVLVSRGSIIPLWKKQIKEGGPITVTHPQMKRFFMSMGEACKLVIKALEVGQPGEILVMDMGKPINIMDLAKQTIRNSGKDIEIKVIGTRPGEKLFEELISADEKIEERDGFFIIKPIGLT